MTVAHLSRVIEMSNAGPVRRVAGERERRVEASACLALRKRTTLLPSRSLNAEGRTENPREKGGMEGTNQNLPPQSERAGESGLKVKMQSCILCQRN